MNMLRWLPFIIAEVLVCLYVFRDALWAQSLLAPLDIAPALFAKYRSLDPTSTGVPANHYTIDQLTYDLPVQYTIYHAVQRGQIPWWDPYTYGGMPLLADAHSNGTDFVRQLVYHLLPFELAYNWTRVLHFLLGGLGLFLLLRRWQFPDWLCLGLALTYQFAGSHVFAFQHPWIQSSFVYYPFLWLVWDQAFAGPRRWHIPVAAFLAAGIFYSGSLQTHTYLILFTAAIGFGYAGWRWADWKRFLPHLVFPPLLAAALATPVLFGQLELFRTGLRSISFSHSPFSFLCGPASLTAIYPWSLGTFRTLSLSKFTGENGLGFNLFVGSAVFVLALLGAVKRTENPLLVRPKRVALALVGIYFLILSTPLLRIFYIRCGTLAVMALILLAALGIQWLARQQLPLRRWAVGVTIVALLLAGGSNIAALVVYPRLLPRVERYVAERAKNNPTLDEAPTLRAFQIKNLPAEVSFRNPETVLGFLALLGVAAFFYWPALRTRRAAWVFLLALNLLPVLTFCYRFLPHQPVALWKRLLEGGPEQKKVMAQLRDTPYRLAEVSLGGNEMVMPGAFPSFYHVRAAHGYSSLVPMSLYTLPENVREKYRAYLADWIYTSPERGMAAGTFSTNHIHGLARFEWLGPGTRTLEITDLSATEQQIKVGPGEAGRLLWADNYSPGWRAFANGVRLPIQKAPPCFSEIQIPAGPQTCLLRYRPTQLRLSSFLAGTALVCSLGLLLLPRREK